MSKRNLTWMIGGMAAMFVLSFAISEFVPDAGAQQVLPGGKAAKTRAYCVEFTGSGVTVIPSVEGVHGFLITDIVAHTDYGSSIPVRLYQNGQLVASVVAATWSNTIDSVPADYHFEAGIPLTSGQPLTASTGSNDVSLTVCGYTY